MKKLSLLNLNKKIKDNSKYSNKTKLIKNKDKTLYNNSNLIYDQDLEGSNSENKKDIIIERNNRKTHINSSTQSDIINMLEEKNSNLEMKNFDFKNIIHSLPKINSNNNEKISTYNNYPFSSRNIVNISIKKFYSKNNKNKKNIL